MRCKGFKEYVLCAGYINTGLLSCFTASTVYVYIFPCLGAPWKFKERDSNEAYIMDQADG